MKTVVNQNGRLKVDPMPNFNFNFNLVKPVPERLHSVFSVELRMTEVLLTAGAIRRAMLQSNRHQQPAFHRPAALLVAQQR